jgi:hypothetical protein
VGSVALHGIESSARGIGCGGGDLDLVERCNSLRRESSGRLDVDARMEGAMEYFGLEGISDGRRKRVGDHGREAVDAHRAPPGDRGVCA